MQAFAVIMTHSFDSEVTCCLFGNYDKAVAYLHWMWEEYYNEELAEDSDLVEDECFHEDEYAKVSWADGEYTEFHLALSTPYDESFFKGNWKMYL